MSASSEKIGKDVERIGEEYGLPADEFKDFQYADLEEGAIAATAKIPEYNLDEIETVEDLADESYKDVVIGEDGKIYGVKDIELNTHFLADQENYDELFDDKKVLVNAHELNHAAQYSEDELWGDSLQDEYLLSDEMTQQLNYVDELLQLSQDPILGNFVDQELVTAVVEGYTERVTEAMVEDGEILGQGVYDSETAMADYVMRINGIDPDLEFDQDIDTEEAYDNVLQDASGVDAVSTETTYSSPQQAASV